MKKIFMALLALQICLSGFSVGTVSAYEISTEHKHTWVETKETIHHDAEYATKTTWYKQRYARNVAKGILPPGPNKYDIDLTDTSAGYIWSEYTDYYDLMCWYYGSLENVPKKWMRFITKDNYEVFDFTYDEYLNLCPKYDIFGNKNPEFDPEHDAIAVYISPAVSYACEGPGGIVDLGLGTASGGYLWDIVVCDLDGYNPFFPASQEQVIDKDAYDEVITHHVCDNCGESYDTSEIVTIPVVTEPITTTTTTTTTIPTTTTTTVSTEYVHIHEDLEEWGISEYVNVETETVHHDAVNTTKTIWLYDLEWISNLPKGTIPEGANKYHLDYHDNVLETFTDMYDIYCWYYGSLDNIPKERIRQKITLESVNGDRDYFYNMNSKKDHFGNYHPEVGDYDEFYAMNDDACDEALYGDNDSVFEKLSKYADLSDISEYVTVANPEDFDDNNICYYYPVAQEPVVIEAYDEKITYYLCEYCGEEYETVETLKNTEPLVTTTVSETTTTMTTTTLTTTVNTITESTTTSTTAPITTTEQKYVPVFGDVNCDGEVDIRDVIILNRYLNNTYELSDQAKVNADCYNPQDMNFNPVSAETVEINEEDSMAIMNHIVHIITLPVQDIELTNVVIGDANGDGEFTVADIVILQNWLLAKPDVHFINWQVVDFNGDNQIDVFDLVLMKRLFINNI